MKIWIWALWYSTTVYFHWNNILSPIPWSNYSEQLYVLAKLAAAIMCHQRNDHICNHKRPPAQICHLFSIQGQPFKIHETIMRCWKFSFCFKACTALVPREKHFAIYTLVNIGGVSVQHFVLRMRSCLLNKKEKTGLHLQYVRCFVLDRAGCVAWCEGTVGKKVLGLKSVCEVVRRLFSRRLPKKALPFFLWPYWPAMGDCATKKTQFCKTPPVPVKICVLFPQKHFPSQWTPSPPLSLGLLTPFHKPTALRSRHTVEYPHLSTFLSSPPVNLEVGIVSGVVNWDRADIYWIIPSPSPILMRASP